MTYKCPLPPPLHSDSGPDHELRPNYDRLGLELNQRSSFQDEARAGPLHLLSAMIYSASHETSRHLSPSSAPSQKLDAAAAAAAMALGG